MSSLKELDRVISEVELPKLTRRVSPHGFPKVDMSRYEVDYEDGDDEGDYFLEARVILDISNIVKDHFEGDIDTVDLNASTDKLDILVSDIFLMDMSISDFHINIEDGLIGDNSFSSVVYPHNDGVEYDYDEDLTVDLEIK